MSMIIRKNIEGFEINYGELKEIVIGGIQCYMDEFHAKKLGFEITDGDVGEFLTDIQVTVSQEEGFWEYHLLVKDKADLKKIAMEVNTKTLNGNPLIGSICAKARVLYRCKNGKVVSERSLESFYSDLTETEKEYFAI